MSNTNNPHGCWPLGTSLSGGPQSVEFFNKPASDGVAIFRNDVVVRAGGALTHTGTPGTSPWEGVALNYGALSTLTEHAVIVSPDAIYECQMDSTSIAATDLGLNCNFTIGAGSTVTKLSTTVLAGGGKDVTNTLDAKLLNLYPIADNAIGAYARLEIVLNKSRFTGGVLGA